MTYQRRKSKRPAEICAAALDVFTETGFSAAGMSQIAQRAGVSRPTLYLYYDNKQAIFEALIRQSMSPIVLDVGTALDQFVGPTSDLITRTVHLLAARIMQPDVSRILRLMLTEGHRFPELAAFYKAELVDPARAVLQKIINRGIETGEFRPEAAQLDSRFLLTPALLATVWGNLFDFAEPLDLAPAIDGYCDVLLKGLQQPR